VTPVGVFGDSEALETSGITVNFEGLTALDKVDFLLRKREILGLIGPNGAGKTTLVNVLSGFQRPDKGTITLEGKDVTGIPPDRLARTGLARTFQGGRLFGGMTALENAEVGAIGMGLSRRQARERAMQVLEWMDMSDKANLVAASLPYGDERKVGIARALSMMPRYLMLDEPGAGLNDLEADQLMHTIGRIRDEFGCAVLVIEHNMRLIMGVCERIQVLDGGRTLAIGTPQIVQEDARVRAAYLGEGQTRFADR
jgi:branched-chain amino acid transport system ATP-binding protein